MNASQLNVVGWWRGLFAVASACVLPVVQVALARVSDDQCTAR